MSWDYTGDARFAKRLTGTTDVSMALRRFLWAMGATARGVEITSALVSSSASRRPGKTGDILADLTEYWNVYERHMTSLFTFWNMEQLLAAALSEQLKASGLEEHVESGLQRFLQPSETNYFALERRQLARLAARFLREESGSMPSQVSEAAISSHVEFFGFLLAPFNLGAPPSVSSVMERLSAEAEVSSSGGEERPMLELRPDAFADLSEPVRELALLAQELTFWKTERLDVMALGDARAAPLYRDAANTLGVETERLFAMKRDEIAASLLRGKVSVPGQVLDERLRGFCLLLHEAAIDFFEPTRRAGAVTAEAAHDLSGSGPIRGVAASRGKATGTVRIVLDLSDIDRIEAGDVLVTTMTRPEMGVALDRAVAFVTDQGGMMSHAAIISREMGKPCVIGTEVATSLLHDGMRVIVNGDDGTVTIL